MAHLFAGGGDHIRNAAELFRRVQGEKLTPEQTALVLAFWTRVLNWAETRPESPGKLLAALNHLAPYLTTLDSRAKALLLGVVPYVHTDYSTDRMIEELPRLVDSNPAAAAELLECMLDANTPNYDMNDKLKSLLRRLYDMGHRAEVFRCIEKLRKTLRGMVEFYKRLVA
jgi:hypothetical protein